MITASQACLDLIRSFESLRLKAYRCPAGIWTIGYGHTRGVTETTACTPEQAEVWLFEDVAAVERDLRAALACEVTQGQWDALTSLAFNVGARRLPMIAPKFWKAVHAGDRKRAVVELVDINKANGKVFDGLTARRKAEAALFLS